MYVKSWSVSLIMSGINFMIYGMLLTDLQADVELLLECIKCQIHSPAAVRQALLTIASMCSTQGKLGGAVVARFNPTYRRFET